MINNIAPMPTQNPWAWAWVWVWAPNVRLCYLSIHAHVFMPLLELVCVYVHDVCMCVHVCVRAYTCMYVCMYVWVASVDQTHLPRSSSTPSIIKSQLALTNAPGSPAFRLGWGGESLGTRAFPNPNLLHSNLDNVTPSVPPNSVIYLIMSHLEDLCILWYYQRNGQKQKQIKITMFKRQ